MSDLKTRIAKRPLQYEGRLLAHARRLAGLTQVELAEKTGDKPADISNMERDRVRVQRRVWLALGVHPDELPPTPEDPWRAILVRLPMRAAQIYESWPPAERADRLARLIMAG
jgi:transcriptional regulator with XRE-family HTH domain